MGSKPTFPRLLSAEVLLGLGACELRKRLATGALDAVDLVEACLERIAALEPQIGAWAWLEGDYALEQARSLDQRRRAGHPIGPLHGLPVAIKDVIDTKGIQTENGTSLDQGRVPTADATVVARLKAAGAIIMGKTVSTELAFMHPGKTRNPHNTDHTPGGSSSGSAAAVAALMVPLAIGTQTGGSVIRPAAYCGIVGYKPSFGMISRKGVLTQSPSLDTMGVFALSVEDAALLAEVLMGYDEDDPATQMLPTPRLLASAQSRPPVRPTYALLTLPHHDQMSEEMQSAMAELEEHLGDLVFPTRLSSSYDTLGVMRLRLNQAELAHHYRGYAQRGLSALSPLMQDEIKAGLAVSAADYLEALDWRGVFNQGLEQLFGDCDAIICAATPTTAPQGMATGTAVFNGLWTYLGLPAITLPLLSAPSGLPIGVQMVARRGDDARLLRNAAWLTQHLLGPQSSETLSQQGQSQ